MKVLDTQKTHFQLFTKKATHTWKLVVSFEKQLGVKSWSNDSQKSKLHYPFCDVWY